MVIRTTVFWHWFCVRKVNVSGYHSLGRIAFIRYTGHITLALELSYVRPSRMDISPGEGSGGQGMSAATREQRRQLFQPAEWTLETLVLAQLVSRTMVPSEGRRNQQRGEQMWTKGWIEHKGGTRVNIKGRCSIFQENGMLWHMNWMQCLCKILYSLNSMLFLEMWISL